MAHAAVLDTLDEILQTDAILQCGHSTEKPQSSDIKVVQDLKSTELELFTEISGNAALAETELSSKSQKTCLSIKWKARAQFSSLCFVMFLGGWDAGTFGPLIPRVQAYYDVNFTIVSLIFMVNCFGFVLGATMNVYMTDRFGFGKVITMGSISQLMAYVIMASAPPFPAFCFAYLLNGWGIALQDAQANGYVASLTENTHMKMGVVQAMFGVGAVCSPFSATRFAELPRSWHYHFLVSLGITVINTTFLVIVFRGKTQDECLQEIGEAARPVGTSQDSKYKQILSQKVVHLLSLISLFYVGIELTTGGWTVTYIIKDRHGNASSGYVSTGFYAGLTLGRVAPLWINKKVGEHLVMFIYTALAIGFELVVWFVPSLIGDAVAVALVGFVIGPVYPIILNEAGRLIPPWLLTGSIGWIASMGFAGSAFFPFITGALASRFGIVSLQPLLIIMMASMFILWAFVPNGNRRSTE